MPRQQSLFDTEPAPWELDDASERLVATVVLSSGPAGEFDYLVPDDLAADGRPAMRVEPGRRVRVPLGRGDRIVVAYCVALGTKPTGGRKLKAVFHVMDAEPLLSPAMLRLTRWMADYYLCPWGQVLEAVVPAGVRDRAGTRDVKLLSVATGVVEQLTQLELPPKQSEALRVLAASARPLTAKQLASRAGCTLAPIQVLRKRGLITESVERLRVG